MGTKKCSKCGEHKDLEAFSKRAASRDGLQSQCKACFRQHYQDNKDQKRRYYEENREAIRERHRRYNQENAESIAEQKRKYNQENAEARRAYQRQWELDNPDKVAARDHRRRARKAAVHSDGFVLDIRGQDCYVCGKPAEAVDHIVPLSKGGPNTRINLAPICKGCNSSKSASVWPGMVEWEGFVARRRALAGA